MRGRSSRSVRGIVLAHCTDDRGMALAITIILLLSLAAMAMTATLVGSTDLLVAGNQRSHSAALDVAEAGVAEALNRMSLRPGRTLDVAGVEVDPSIQDPQSPPDPDWRTRIFLTAPTDQIHVSGSEYRTGTVQAPGSYLEYSHADDPAEALVIQHKLRDFDGDGVEEVVRYDPSRIPPENPLSGSPVELITAVGRVGVARRTVQVEATRFPLYPNVTAALSANGTCDLRGNVTVCGHNHRIDTPPRTDLPQCSPAWDEATGHLPGVMTTGYDVMRRGSADLLGSPAVVDTSSSNVFYSLSQALGITEAELEDILSSPDFTAADRSVYMEGITYIQGDCLATVIDGEGLLYVTGDLTVSGNIEWTGLVYVEGSFRSTGNAWILGAVMVEGDSTIALDFGSGNPSVLYSREALLRALTRCMRYVTLSWRELD